MQNSHEANSAIPSSIEPSDLTIMLAIQNHDARQQVKTLLAPQGFGFLETHASPERIGDRVHDAQPCLLILEAPWTHQTDTLALALKIRTEHKRLPIILVTGQGSEALAVSALRAELNDYFTLPLPAHGFNQAVQRCIANYRPPSTSRQDDQLIGASSSMSKVKSYLQKLALVDSHVLITGETGTGKELTAQYIHQHSGRQAKPLIAINCAAIPESLLESELFGYEKGAFTGAHASYAGKLKLADGGSVFFDEIGDMSPYAQAKILRVLESKEVYPLGARRSMPLDIRVIAATNCDLENMVLQKIFRQDLYFRLNVARVQLPPLRERKEDISGLVDYYLRAFNERFGWEHPGFTGEAWELLLSYDWPGNIRELKNVLEASYIDSALGRITPDKLPDLLRSPRQQQPQAPVAERELLLSALSSVHWNKSKAAEQLHWSRMKLYRKMAQHHISDMEMNASNACTFEAKL